MHALGGKAEDTRLKLGDIAAFLRSHRALSVAIPLAFVVLGLVMYLMMEPVYRSEAVLLPVSDEQESSHLAGLAGQFGALASFGGFNLNSGSSTAANIAILRSKDLVARFIERENLMKVLHAALWDEVNQSWRKEPPTIEETIRMFDEDIRTVFEDKASGLVVLRIDWNDPLIARSWAEKLVEMSNTEIRNRTVSEARASKAFLESELAATDVVELRQSIFRLLESETKKIMLANIRREYAFRTIDPPRAADAADPVWPNLTLIVMTAMLVGCGLLIVVAVARARPAPN